MNSPSLDGGMRATSCEVVGIRCASACRSLCSADLSCHLFISPSSALFAPLVTSYFTQNRVSESQRRNCALTLNGLKSSVKIQFVIRARSCVTRADEAVVGEVEYRVWSDS